MIQDNLLTRVIVYEIIGFSIVIIVVWIDGLFDIPHHLFGQEGNAVNITESIFEAIIVLLLSIGIISLTSNLLARIKSSEAALRHKEAHFRSLIEHASDITLVLNETGEIFYSSPSLERLLGYKPGHLIGRNIFVFIHHDDKFKLRNALTQATRNSDQVGPIELQIRDKEDVWRTLEAISSNLLADAEIAGLVVNARDITRRKQLESQLIQAQKMEAIGRLAGGVAHHFNNLLTVIIGYSSLILTRLDKDNPLCQDVEQVKNAADQAATLTRQILAFSRKQMFELKVLDLNILVVDMAKMLQQLLGEDIKLIIKLNRRLWPVKGDASQIAQVIMSMAVNARDAMPQGGQLTIETANGELDQGFTEPHPGLQPGPYVTLTISDTGMGMNADTLAHLFEPFFTTKEPGQGTGLGLATAHGIIKQSGGHIAVYSQPEHGATFKVYLPQAEGVVEPSSLEPAIEVAQGQETILVVEDEDMVRKLICDSLGEMGYIILPARYGLEALQIARQYLGSIHLLLTDVVLPGPDGRQLANQLTLLYPEIKVLYISGYTENIMARHGVLDADIAFLAKPFSPADLARRIRKTLDTP